jgi:hypothetical protein
MRPLFHLACLAALMFPATAALAAEEVTVAELQAESPDLSGSEVNVEGELVGDYGFRGDGWMWTQLNGDVYVADPIREGGPPAGGNTAVGVRMPSDLAMGLDHPGGYHHRGPVVRLTGIWRYHDPDRHGESYLDVASLEVVQPGRELDEDIVWWTVIAGSGLLAAAGALWLFRPRPEEG